MAKEVVRIDHDDHPEEVAWKFIHALQALGIQVTELDGEKDVPSIEYEIVVNRNQGVLDELNPMKSKGLKA